MTYRVRRKFTSSKFCIDGQFCKVFMEPMDEYRPGFYTWNVGFAVGKSNRQLNDWYNRRKNKRARSINNKMTGRSGIKAIRTAFQKVLELRWKIEPGDVIVLDCTSGNSDKQFRAWKRWQQKHQDFIINYSTKEYFWYRPPYPEDPIRKDFNIIPIVPADPFLDTLDSRYYDCFRVQLKVPNTDLSMGQITDLLSPVLTTGRFVEMPT